MISWLRRISPSFIASQYGSVLPVVIMFSLTGLIAVVSFLFFNFSSSRISFDSLSTLQALLNARSGIYRGFDDLVSNGTDSSLVMPLVNTLDSSFGKTMFNGPDDSGKVVLSEDEAKLTLDGGTIRYKLYSRDSTDTADVTLISDGGACVLQSVSSYRKATAKIEATLGSRVPVKPDTVAIAYSAGEWDASGVDGTKITRTGAGDTVSPWLRTMIAKYQETLASSDTGSEPLLTIQSNRDIAKIPRTVLGDLLLDGSFNALVWKDTGTVTILGRMDISGEVTVEGIKFVVGGEVTLSGETYLNQVSLFSQSKIFFADDSRFSGNAMALNSVAIYGNAKIENKSTVIVCGGSENTANDSFAVKGADTTKKIYAVEIGDKAKVDGVIVAVGTPGDIKTHAGVTVTGIMIAQKEIGHLGKMSGLMCCSRFIDPDQSAQVPAVSSTTDQKLKTTAQKNVIKGDLEPLATIEEYKLPFFIGKLAIVKWREF